MAVLEAIPAATLIIRKLIVEERRSHQDVSVILKEKFPYLSQGLSSRTVRRFCKTHNIHRTSRLEGGAVDRIVRTAIQKVRTM